MSLLMAHSTGVYHPYELNLVQRVYQRIADEPWFTQESERRGEFAGYVLSIYGRGLGEERRLYEFCIFAARHKFSSIILQDATGPQQSS